MPTTTVYQNGAPAYTSTDGVNTPIPTTPPTPAQTYKDIDLGTYDNSYDTGLDSAIAGAKAGAAAVPDEDSIYQTKLGQYQSEIDATNKIYAQKLADQKVQDQNNVGSGTAIQARSGTLGSDFATAQTANINTQDNAADSAITDEQQAKVAAILGTARQDADTEYANKLAAQQGSTKDYLTYLGARDDRQTANATKVASALLAQNVDTSQVDPSQLSQIAKTYGISTSDIVTAYNAQKTAKDQADAKTASDEAFNLTPGDTRFSADGTPIASVAAAPKTVGTPATGIYTENPDGSYTQTMAPVGGDNVQSLAQELVTGNLAPQDLSKRSSGVGSYSDILTAANTISQQLYGKPFDIAKATTDYNFANNPQTQNTLNLLGSLTVSADGTSPSSLDQVLALNKTVNAPKGTFGIGSSPFPALNNTAQWAKLETGDPDVAAYHTALAEVANQLATVFQGGTGTSDAKISQAQALFDSGFTPDQMSSVLGAIKPLLQNRASSMVKDNPYLSTYATQFGIQQDNAKAQSANATTNNSDAGFGWDGS